MKVRGRQREREKKSVSSNCGEVHTKVEINPIPTYFREVAGHNGAASRLLVVEAYKCVALVLEVPDLQDLPVQLSKRRTFYLS